ncbi:ABC transporter ATP-binding protein [Candidatus Gracilibacteria bacterium]|nr:ABC transporter ATP-binding protein [Candidatus Gracilibacteria bacterium]
MLLGGQTTGQHRKIAVGTGCGPAAFLLPTKERSCAVSQNKEFSVVDDYQYDTRTTWRWIGSHVRRYWHYALVFFLCYTWSWSAYAGAQALVGRAAEQIIDPNAAFVGTALLILALLVSDSISGLVGALSAENVAARFGADARQELYTSLLGKSKQFHDRQRTGDLMARATDDVNELSNMMVPGSLLVFETVAGIAVPIIYIALTELQLVLVPLLFVVSYIITARHYIRRLNPVVEAQREQFGKLTATLEESVSGIEVVKASAQEPFERAKFRRNARLYRDFFVQQGYIEARYLPLLLYGIAVGLTFLHAISLYRAGTIGIGAVISTMALVNILRFPTFISLFAFSTMQVGYTSAGRILRIIKGESDMDENAGGVAQPIVGEIVFEHVSFGYAAENTTNGAVQPTHILNDISFRIAPGQTVAIVGQTGSGKSALTQLVNRTYSASGGRVLIDGINVEEWSLDALRSQIGKIEQDIFLFSRTIGENIAFGAPDASQEQIEAAARAAQAHDFISGFNEGYNTVVGERGVTLSGGQRQRIALARAFLSNPRILILDDSTSAIDSATEDEIQKALRKAQEGRTVLLITHRLSQIRWADLILVLDQGRVVASGTHDDLLRISPHYRRIFARYDTALPPIEEIVPALA